MTDTLTDWRLFGAHDHLKGLTLWWRAYAPRNQILTQDHCEFCWATFARVGENVWHEGYATQPPYGMSAREPAPSAAASEGDEDEYVTEVLAAVGTGAADEPLRLPALEAALDPALEAAALDVLSQTVPSDPVKLEAVTWICPHCFEDFRARFDWTAISAE